MGAWSHEIMGCDNALDLQFELSQYLGVHEDDMADKERVKHALETTSTVNLVRFVIANQYPRMAARVLMITILSTGCYLSDAMKALFEEHCEFDEEVDGGYRDLEERQRVLTELTERLKVYDGTPMSFDEPRLLETILRGEANKHKKE